MENKPKNPQAFPTQSFRKVGEIEEGKSIPGMSLRDYFAAQALPAVINNSAGRPNVNGWREIIGPVCTLCYLLADEMLKAGGND